LISRENSSREIRPSPKKNIFGVVTKHSGQDAYHWNPLLQMHFQCPTNDCESGPEAPFRKMREGGMS